MDAGLRESWDAVREGLADGAEGSGGAALVASTLPELLQDDSAAAFLARGVPAVAGLRTALACAAALRRPAAGADRLHAIAAAAAAGPGVPGAWLAEADAKAMLRAAGVAVPGGRVVADADDAVAVARELGVAVAIKASSSVLQHKSEIGALALGVTGDAAVRSAYRRVAAAGGQHAEVLVEAMAAPGVELVVAARRDAVVPALVVGTRRDLDRAARRCRDRPAARLARAGGDGAAQPARRRACCSAHAGRSRSTSPPPRRSPRAAATSCSPRGSRCSSSTR